MKTTFLILAILIFMIGCSVSQSIIDKQQWTKENFDYDQYQKDKYQCEHESYMESSHIARDAGDGLIRFSRAVDHRVKRYGSCMKAKGYYQTK